MITRHKPNLTNPKPPPVERAKGRITSKPPITLASAERSSHVDWDPSENDKNEASFGFAN